MIAQKYFETGFRDHLPPWLGGPDAIERTMTPMLTALKSAVEAYLEESLLDAEVVFSYKAPEAYYDAAHSTLTSLGVQVPMWHQLPAGIRAARAYGIGGDCYSPDPDPEQLILTIDYSRGALVALMVDEYCSDFKIDRSLYDTRLGTDTLSEGPEGRQELATALRWLTRLPLERGNGAKLSYISKVVLLGESASDTRLREALREVLREPYGNPTGSGKRLRAIGIIKSGLSIRPLPPREV